MPDTKKTLLIFFLINALLITCSAIAADRNQGIIIPDIDTYPFYHHSKITKQKLDKGLANITLKTSSDISVTHLTAILKNWKLPFEVISENPSIIKTDWLLWHYDKDTNKTLSEPQNHFFSLNTRDRYRFKFKIEADKEKSLLRLSQSWREQEVDITPDSAMVWLKWSATPIDSNAIKGFLLRLQTEFEKITIAENDSALSENKNMAVATVSTPSANTASTPENQTNFQTINESIDVVWSQLILTLGNKNIPIESADNQQHIIKTNWYQPAFDKHARQHRFKITLTAGGTPDKSSIFIHHLAVDDKEGNEKDFESSKDKRVLEAEFLNQLHLKP